MLYEIKEKYQKYTQICITAKDILVLSIILFISTNNFATNLVKWICNTYTA